MNLRGPNGTIHNLALAKIIYIALDPDFQRHQNGWQWGLRDEDPVWTVFADAEPISGPGCKQAIRAILDNLADRLGTTDWKDIPNTTK